MRPMHFKAIEVKVAVLLHKDVIFLCQLSSKNDL